MIHSSAGHRGANKSSLADNFKEVVEEENGEEDDKEFVRGRKARIRMM